MAWCQCAMDTFSARHGPDHVHAPGNAAIIFSLSSLNSADAYCELARNKRAKQSVSLEVVSATHTVCVAAWI